MTIGQEIDLGWIAVVLLAITALIVQGRISTKTCWLTGVVLDGCALVPECSTRQVECCCAMVLSPVCQRRERIMAVQRIKGQLGLEIVLLGEAVGGSVSSSEWLVNIAGVQNAEELALEVELKHGRR